MKDNAQQFLAKALGEDFEDLFKTEIYKPGSRSTIDTSDMHLGLKLVPRTLMSLLIRELAPMAVGETKEVKIPGSKDVLLRANKHERDSLSGELIEDNKKIAEFMHRSIPGIGLVLLSALELYELDELDQKHGESSLDHDMSETVQKIIDERLALHSLINSVIDKKLSEKDAIQELLMQRLTDQFDKKKDQISQLADISRTSAPMTDPYFQGMASGVAVADAVVNDKEPEFVSTPKKGSPLKDFVEARKNKLKKNEFSVVMSKGEHVNCPECGSNIFDGDSINPCICYGEDMGRKIFIRKNEEGISVKFSKNFDHENIEQLLEVLRNKNK